MPRAILLAIGTAMLLSCTATGTGTITPGGGGGGTAVPSATASPTTATTATVVTVRDFAFEPATLSVNVGTRVTWRFVGPSQHTVTSDNLRMLDSGVKNPGDTFTVTFTQAGVVNYHCQIHPAMHGQIRVGMGGGGGIATTAPSMMPSAKASTTTLPPQPTTHAGY